jgi:hypothetical protein
MIRFCSVLLLGIAASSICMPAPVAAAPMPSGGGTAVTVDGASVTISVHIDLCCLPEHASQRDVWTPLVLAEIKATQDMWNQALAVLPAKGCYNIRVVFDPGC